MVTNDGAKIHPPAERDRNGLAIAVLSVITYHGAARAAFGGQSAPGLISPLATDQALRQRPLGYFPAAMLSNRGLRP
jgi:hypothetical protein